MAKKVTKRFTAYSWLILNTLLWGVIPVIAKYNLATTTPFRFLFYRFLFAAIFSLPIIFFYWPKIKNLAKTIFTIAGLEVIGTVLTLALLYVGLQRTTATEASLITALSPLFVAWGGWFWLHEKIEGHEKLGLLIALLGSVLLALTPILINGQASGLSLLGSLLIFAQDLVYVGYLLVIKKRYQKIPKFFVTAISFWVGLVAFLVLSLFEVNLNTAELTQLINSELLGNWQTLVIAIYMAVGGSILGLTAYLKGHDLIEASEASLFWYLQPLVTIPLGMYFLQEKLYWSQGIALALIFLGVLVAERRKPRVL